MKHLALALALGLAASATVAPHAAAQGRTIGQRVDDAAITASVKTKLVADQAKNLVHVDVDTRSGVVHLQGMVPTERDKIQAEQLARSTDGVVSVQNDLVVGSSGAASPRTR
jgi:osmotically-inducible protein OsmY